jgi:hypothetical protein
MVKFCLGRGPITGIQVSITLVACLCVCTCHQDYFCSEECIFGIFYICNTLFGALLSNIPLRPSCNSNMIPELDNQNF